VSKRNQIKTHSLARFMLYILAHKPDEFGLVPDTEGFVTYKELLWVIHEEPGWGYVRKGHINEVLSGKDRALFQPNENGIRALERRWHLDLDNPSLFPPKILFVAVRRRAHPAVMEKGLAASGGKYIVLSSDRDVAERIGRRRDQKPVVLEIMVAPAQEAGVLFYAFGSLFLADQVPARFINGPPISKKDGKTPERKGEEKGLDFEAGTLVLDLNRDPDPSRRTRGKKQKSWKEEARRIRRRKRHR
jgi:putative RNA 2'-phosphotransferase